MNQYWIPEELWRIVKNYMLGADHWKRKLSTHCFSGITARASWHNLGIINTGKLMGSYPHNYRIITFLYCCPGVNNQENVSEQQSAYTYFGYKFYNRDMAYRRRYL